jgi:hypothetical protein
MRRAAGVLALESAASAGEQRRARGRARFALEHRFRVTKALAGYLSFKVLDAYLGGRVPGREPEAGEIGDDTHQDGSRLPSKKCVDGSDNRLGKFLFQIIEATRGGMPARDGNRSPRDDGSWGSRAKDFVICAEAACIDRLPYCNRGAVEASWLYCCSYRGPTAYRTEERNGNC